MVQSPTVLVTTVRGALHQRDGRLGHECKNVWSGLVLARVMNWSYTPPSAVDEERGFADVDNVLSLRLLAPQPRLHLGQQGLKAWFPMGRCPQWWHRVVLNETTFAGIEEHSAFVDHIRRRVPVELEARGRLCVMTTQGFRAHLNHLHAWVQQGAVHASAYEDVTSSLRRALRPATGPSPWLGPLASSAADGIKLPRAMAGAVAATGRATGAVPGSAIGRAGRIAIHVRRGDRVGRAADRYSLPRIQSFVSLSAASLLRSGLYPAGVEVVVFTEPGNSSDVFASACPAAADLDDLVRGAVALRGAAVESAPPWARASCRVRTGPLLEDLWGLVGSDVLGISSSGFSVLAYYLRGPRQPTLVPLRHVAQFFGAADGSDGRSAKRQVKHSRRAGGGGPAARPPENVFFVVRALEAMESGGGPRGGNTTATAVVDEAVAGLARAASAALGS